RREFSQRKVEVREVLDLVLAELDDAISRLEASLVGRTSRSDPRQGIARFFGAEIGDAAEIGAASGPLADLRAPLHGAIVRRFSQAGGFDRESFDQIDDPRGAGNIDLLPVVGRAVIVAVRAREKV